MILTYRYRLLPSKRQHAVLAAICEAQQQLYNAALEERIDCYRKTGKSLSYIDQCKGLTACRRELPEIAALPLKIQRWTLKRLDDAFAAFFRRLKAKNGKAGFPRFRSKDRWDSFGFAEFSGIRWDGKRLRFAELPGALRVHLHRPLPDDADIRSCVFRRDGNGWHICFQIAVEAAEKRAVSALVGVDLGLKAFAHCTDGVIIPNPRIARRAEREMRRRHRALARCQRGSRRRVKVKARLLAASRKIADSRRTWLHQQSAALVKRADLIAVEDLNVKGLARSMLTKSVHDASWSTFVNMLFYKAEWAGKTLIKVDAKLTTQACSGCGVIVPKGLGVRVHSCPDCGLILDRDHNAALNILRKAVVGLGVANVAQWRERRPGNLSLVSD